MTTTIYIPSWIATLSEGLQAEIAQLRGDGHHIVLYTHDGYVSVTQGLRDDPARRSLSAVRRDGRPAPARAEPGALRTDHAFLPPQLDRDPERAPGRGQLTGRA